MKTATERIQALLFGILFFFSPLLLSPATYELFEFNKMLFVYAMAILITGVWAGSVVVTGKFKVKQTPLDIPLLLFLAVQIVSTVLSIDPHGSIYGYYGRFNGGLLSYLAYMALYFAFVHTVSKRHVQRILYTGIASGVFVAGYGIAQHFGIDAHLWVQDVQNRVFSTLGQPNWLAACMAILGPIAMALAVVSSVTYQVSRRSKIAIANLKNTIPVVTILLTVITSALYLTLLYTKSRSGFFGFWFADILFWIITLGIVRSHITPASEEASSAIERLRTHARVLFSHLKPNNTELRNNNPLVAPVLSLFILLNTVFIITAVFVWTPFGQIGTFSLTAPGSPEFSAPTSEQESTASGGELLITDSGDIRKIVWQGAVDAAIERPVLGWGPETFAWIYYRFRPVEHNTTSEWDFLYNKAHNEYLNYAATIGFFGLAVYLLIPFVFILWFVRFLRNTKKKKPKHILQRLASRFHSFFGLHIQTTERVSRKRFIKHVVVIGLFASWTSILITNFFGFSVVVTSLYFYLIPAMAFVLAYEKKGRPTARSPQETPRGLQQVVMNIILAPKAFIERKLRKPTKQAVPPELSDNPVQAITQLTALQWIALGIASGITLFLLLSVVRYWYADYLYAKGKSYDRSQQVSQALEFYTKAYRARPYEPLYQSDLSEAFAYYALGLYEQQDEEYEQAADQAIRFSNASLASSPYNVSFWKTRTRVFYALSQIDEAYLDQAIESLQMAKKRAPTDAKVLYNLSVLYEARGERDSAIETMKQAIMIKPNYKDAAYALYVFYRESGEEEEALQWLNYILESIDPNDQEVLRILETS